jgi:hypothetical protein
MRSEVLLEVPKLVKEIGLRSDSIDFGWVIFPSGNTSADFHSLGTSPFLIDALKMEQTG